MKLIMELKVKVLMTDQAYKEISEEALGNLCDELEDLRDEIEAAVAGYALPNDDCQVEVEG